MGEVYVPCRVSRGFFDSECYVMLNDSSALVSRRNVRIASDRPSGTEVDGFVLAYVIECEHDKILVQLPGEAVVGGLRTWIDRTVLAEA